MLLHCDTNSDGIAHSCSALSSIVEYLQNFHDHMFWMLVNFDVWLRKFIHLCKNSNFLNKTSFPGYLKKLTRLRRMETVLSQIYWKIAFRDSGSLRLVFWGTNNVQVYSEIPLLFFFLLYNCSHSLVCRGGNSWIDQPTRHEPGLKLVGPSLAYLGLVINKFMWLTWALNGNGLDSGMTKIDLINNQLEYGNMSSSRNC